jgi:3-oxoacyl-[acyl-carrier protein] reductase
MSSAVELTDRTVLVTGASRGIGLAIARSVLLAGGRVIAVARDPARLERAAARLSEDAPPGPGSHAPSLLALPADVGDPRSVTELFAHVAAAFPRLDAVVNAAGVLHRARIVDTPVADWEESLRVNLTGVFLCSQAAARLMLAQPPEPGGLKGHIVQIVSGSGVHGWVGAAAYTAAKHGVMGFSEVLRDELREQGVKVTTVLPGMVATDMTAHPDFAERHKLRPEDVAHAVLAVLTASPDAMLTRVDVRHRRPL